MDRAYFDQDHATKAADFKRLIDFYVDDADVEVRNKSSKLPTVLPDFGIVLRDSAGAVSLDYILFCNQIDELLEQSIQCLDRCLSDKAIYDVLRLECLRLALELYEAQQLDNIIRDQQSVDDFWKAGEKQAGLEQAARQQLLTSTSPTSLLTSNTYSGMLEEVMAYSASQMTSDYFRGAGERQWTHSAKQDGAAAAQAKSNEAANNELEKLAQSRIDQARVARESEERRIDLKRDLLAYRADETTRIGSILNYGERIAEVTRRATRDFEEAAAKAVAVYAGVTRVLGVACNKIDFSEMERPLDGLIHWVRSTKAVINKVRLSEQRAIFRIPLSSVVDLSKLWAFQKLEFEIPASIAVDGRLAGLSASLATEGDGFVALSVSLPKQTLDDFGDLDSVTVHIGRVLHNPRANTADVYGLPLIRNRSFKGNWTIEMLQGSSKSNDDIYLDLLVLY